MTKPSNITGPQALKAITEAWPQHYDLQLSIIKAYIAEREAARTPAKKDIRPVVKADRVTAASEG